MTVWHGLADLGATGVLVPPDHDGAGMTMVEAGVVAEELGAALISRAVAVECGRRHASPDTDRCGRRIAG